ncbi:hypothetical protein [Desulfovermiculus halophilus]|uniref:hypothetical protein n=1 Tax=Desulfovermiculus halophilus TaxID=339722 RepID=UPI000484068E|nr:hypothetical protein [Desulfovermiculus halophilus]
MTNEELTQLAKKTRQLFVDQQGRFSPDDFIAVARELGFYAYSKSGSHEQGKIGGLGDNNLPDIIGTNLQHALDYYEWRVHVPMTEDGVIVSSFWDSSKESMPEGYELVMEGKALKKRGS